MALQTVPSASLIIADARIHGQVDIRSDSPKRFRVRAGEDLFVRFTYRFSEASREHEDCHIRLTSRLGDEAPDPVDVKITDRPVLPDEVWGSLQQHYTKLPRGLHVLSFQAEAWLRVRKWSQDSALRVDSKKIEGNIEILVE